jgi:hypothetical protein
VDGGSQEPEIPRDGWTVPPPPPGPPTGPADLAASVRAFLLTHVVAFLVALPLPAYRVITLGCAEHTLACAWSNVPLTVGLLGVLTLIIGGISAIVGGILLPLFRQALRPVAAGILAALLGLSVALLAAVCFGLYGHL